MDEKREPEEGIVLTEAQFRNSSQRSIAPEGLVLLFFAVTFRDPAVLSRPL